VGWATFPGPLGLEISNRSQANLAGPGMGERVDRFCDENKNTAVKRRVGNIHDQTTRIHSLDVHLTRDGNTAGRWSVPCPAPIPSSPYRSLLPVPIPSLPGNERRPPPSRGLAPTTRTRPFFRRSVDRHHKNVGLRCWSRSWRRPLAAGGKSGRDRERA
jgi:hypothetical protein